MDRHRQSHAAELVVERWRLEVALEICRYCGAGLGRQHRRPVGADGRLVEVGDAVTGFEAIDCNRRSEVDRIVETLATVGTEPFPGDQILDPNPVIEEEREVAFST